MVMLKATKVRLYPTPEQAAFLNRQFGSVRFVYNAGLRILSHRYRVHGQFLSAKHDIKKLLPITKTSRKYGWLREADSMALQQACLNLDHAFQRFFDPIQRAGYPRFKSKRGKQSSYHCVGVKVGDDWIKVPKLEPIKAKAQGKPLVKLDPWFASFKTCHVCHHKMDVMPLSVCEWACPGCGTAHDRESTPR